VDDVAVPAYAADQILVQVEASSLNALDWHFLTGTPYVLRLQNGLRTPKRQLLGADFAGLVVGVGSDVAGYAIGDRVFGECEGGGCSPYVAVDPSHAARIPEDVSYVDAAATPVAGLTAIQGLRTHANVQPGERVLINGAAGGVGTFAVQVAKMLGAHVTAVCSTKNVDMVRSLGADAVIDYTTTDFVAKEHRFHVMMDNVGNRTPKECLGLLEQVGRYVIVSGPKENRWLGPIPHVARKALGFRRASQSFHQFVASPNTQDLEDLGEALATGALNPQIYRTTDLDGVAEAMAEIGGGHTPAKIVVIPT
jgi:NADPH:quinone reductase-like Zn-dependent oxidoreductase